MMKRGKGMTYTRWSRQARLIYAIDCGRERMKGTREEEVLFCTYASGIRSYVTLYAQQAPSVRARTTVAAWASTGDRKG